MVISQLKQLQSSDLSGNNIFLVEDAAAAFVFKLQCALGNGVVRVIRGHKCTSYEALHNEIAAALQFPDYYGENWDALDECLGDLDWLPGDWYFLPKGNS